jgi:signal transduction histidine kinase
MRLIKEKTQEYESFHKSLQYFTKSSETKGDLRLISFESHRNNSTLLEKYSFFVQNLFSFQNKAKNAGNIKEIHSIFQEFVKRIIFAKEVEIFLFNDSQRNLLPISSNASQSHVSAANKAYKDGILDWIFETKKPTIIPELSSYTINGSKINQIIFPVYDKKSNYGILSLLSPISKVQEDSLENRAIQIVLSIIVPLILSIKQKQSINKLYQEVQVYQSKLNNDFETYAIGELAEGIIEDIGEPLQVILSYADMIANEFPEVDKNIPNKIKKQVQKVSELSNRLAKFSGLNKPKRPMNQPCDLNKIVKEFKNVVNSTLRNLGLDCELDLEENIPPVLSELNDVKQLLTSIFSLLKSGAKKGGAVVITTKYIKERIILSVFTTQQISGIASQDEQSSNVTANLIKELMRKNEGTVEFNSLPLQGTIIHLIFPLKRKLIA